MMNTTASFEFCFAVGSFDLAPVRPSTEAIDNECSAHDQNGAVP